MKARFFALAALVLGMVSCQQDFNGLTPVPVGGEVDFQLAVAAPELGTTRADDGDEQYGNDSAFGAIDYLSDEADQYRTDWSDVNLRYTLEVYDVDGLTATPVKDRQVIIVDKYEPVKFDLRLVPNRDYQFVVFADFVPQAFTDVTATDAVQSEAGLHHTIGSTLQSITIKEDAINDECTDAYFVSEKIKIENSAPKSITLKRPYGKVRVIATDLAELNLNYDPASVEVAYTAIHPQTFNAVLGTIGTEEQEKVYALSSAYNEGVGKESLANHFYTADYDAKTTTNAKGDKRHTHMTLFTDYILANTDQSSIHFTMKVYDKEKGLIKETAFDTDIPVQRNSLTTIIGNVLTTATEINITIDDNFGSEYNYQLWDGKSIKEPKMEGEFYVIYEAAELAWLAYQVNNKGQKFNGKTFKLGKDIHLNHELWTPIGATGKFEGTFDGRYKDVDHKLEGLFVSVEGKAAAGLFANAKYVRNLTVLNSQIYGQYKTGVIVGDGLCSRIDNCHVDGCEVLVTPYNKDEANNVGGIVGYLSAENEAWVKDCSVKNTKITAYRKVGGIAGAANQAAVVTGNSVENITVVADMTSDYKEVKAADAGAIVGYVHAKATVENNAKSGNVSVTVVIDVDDERDAYVAKTDEVIHVTFKAGEYNFAKDLYVNGAVQARRGGEVVLNANGQTITSGTASDYGFNARGEGNTLVVNDAVVVSNGGAFAAAEGAKIIFNGKSVAVNTTSTSGRYHFYATTGGQIEINGGTFNLNTSKSTKRAYVYADGSAKVIINGGTFGKASTRSDYKAGIMGAGEVIIYGGTFGFDPSKWVAPGYFTVKEGANWVVKAPVVVNDASELADAVANAAEGTQIVLADNANYGTVTLGELKGVTINGDATSKVRFVTTADSILENVKIEGVGFEFVTGANQKNGAFVVIDPAAQIENLVIEGCNIVGDGKKNSYGIYGQNPNATIVVKDCNFSNLGYAIQTIAGGGYKSLTVESCTFENIISWAILPQYGYTGDLTINNCAFTNTNGGLVKTGAFDGTFTFTNNEIVNSVGHDGKDSKWFEVNASTATKVVSGNTKDGAEWTPGEAEGLK